MKTLFVAGAGTMGAGIAEVAARSGLKVKLFDVDQARAQAGLTKIQASLDKAVSREKISSEVRSQSLANIEPICSTEPVAECQLVIEAAPEKMELKKKLFKEFGEMAPGALLATNTSSLSVTEIAAATTCPDRVVGMHFFNPAPIMPLLEIVVAEQTSQATETEARALAEQFGKTPIVVSDVAGFATSRLGIILGMEAIRMVESGVATVADIDKAMELGYRHPMGPLKLTDLVGLDVRLAIAEHLTHELGPQFTPPPLLRRLVRAGHLGKKTGRGFYRWEGNRAMPT